VKLKLPEILAKIPPKLYPLITELDLWDYFLLEGGRSGGKSHAVARLLLYLADRKKLRIVCGREIQHSIDESVYSILVDLIREYKLDYQILATEIRHIRTESVFNFRGFREQGRQNIKGLEGVDVLWVDESQSITKETLDIIVPTIRKQNSIIFWTMNRFIEEDAVYNRFYDHKRCLHIYINYLENPTCPQKMIDEADVCKQLSTEDYEHIWLGMPRKDGGVIKLVTPAMYNELRGIKFNRAITKRLFTGDPSLGGDECVGYILDENGQKIDSLILHERDEMKIAGAWVAFANRYGVKDYIIDIIGFKGIADRIRELIKGVNMIENIGSGKSGQPDDYLNLRAEIHMYAQQEIIQHRVEYFNDPIMVQQLCNILIKPINSRKIRIESKAEMRKRIQKSPDRADAYLQGLWGLQFAQAWRKDVYEEEEEEVAVDWRGA
jgi:phage terminase large subunit